jgi:hypothetical protein
MKDFTATINKESARYQEWVDVIGTNEFPIKSPIPEWISAPSVGRAPFYQMDLAQLTGEQRAKLIKHIAAKFSVDEQEVVSTLDEVGCPILAEDVTVTVYRPQRWI